MSSTNIYLQKLKQLSENQTKYLKWYISIIETALNRTNLNFCYSTQKSLLIEKFGYIESHHIIPKCLNKKYEKHKSNLVFLTAKEHHTCHLLLVKIFPSNSGLVKAANMMSVDSNGNRINNKKYDWIRKKLSENQKGEKNHNYGKVGEKSATFGTKRKLSVQTKQNMSKAKSKENHNLWGKIFINNGTENLIINKDDPIPDGWIKGKVKGRNKLFLCIIENKKQYTKNNISAWYPEFKQYF